MSYLKSLKKLANVLQITSILANGIYQQPSIEIKEYQNIVNTTFWYSLNLLPNRPFHIRINFLTSIISCQSKESRSIIVSQLVNSYQQLSKQDGQNLVNLNMLLGAK